MTTRANRTFVGFGFGAIQAGLFLYEAQRSENFGRLIVAEVVPQVVEEIRQANGMYALNIAESDHIESVQVGPIQIENPAIAQDRERLIQAIADADEISTAVPSVDYYVSDGPGSPHQILAEGLQRKAAQNNVPAVIYTAENNNHAAEILEMRIMEMVPQAEHETVRSKVRFLNTVIAKMGGVVTDQEQIQQQRLLTVSPTNKRAYLVEAFNRIQITKINFDGQPFERGIAVFEEKSDLIPFEENKLYGHNAVHALAAYIGAVRGVRFITDLNQILGMRHFLEQALIEESGKALMYRYAGLDDLFSTDGYDRYARDLFTRMMNPHLMDTVERVGRNPERKLGWDDRLIGVMRLALQADMKPYRYALGAAAALAIVAPSILTTNIQIENILFPLWAAAKADPEEQSKILQLVNIGIHALKQWIESGYSNLDQVYQSMKY